MYVDEFKTFKSPTAGLTIERSRHYYIPKDVGFSASKPSKVAEIFEEIMDVSMLPEEFVWALALDNKLHPVGLFEIVHGTSEKAYIDVKDVYKRLLLVNAAGFVLVHNHPSKDPLPSDPDKVLANKLTDAGDLLGIKMVDFLIVCDENCYFSFLNNGLLAKS